MKSTSRLLAVVCLGASLAVATTALFALSSDQEQPLNIEADSVEIDDRSGVSVYRGNVEVQQGSIRLLADKVTVHHDQQHKAKRIVAEGKPARYRQLLDDSPQEVTARARRMEYDAASEELYLIDEAVLIQGQDRFSSDRITYDRKRALVKGGASAKGQQRVRITVDTSKK